MTKKKATQLKGRDFQFKIAEKKEVCSSPVKAQKLQLAVEQPLTGECWNTTKNDIPCPKTKKKLQWDGRRNAKMIKSNPTYLQGQIPCEFPVPLPDPQVGNPDLGLRTFTTMGEPLWYSCSPLCGSLTQQVWDLFLSWFHPSYHLTVASSLSLDMGYLFLASFCWWLFNSYQKHQKLQLLLAQCLLPHGR